MLPNVWLLNPPVGGGRIDILIWGRMDGTVVDLVAEEIGLDSAMDGSKVVPAAETMFDFRSMRGGAVFGTIGGRSTLWIGPKVAFLAPSVFVVLERLVGLPIKSGQELVSFGTSSAKKSKTSFSKNIRLSFFI